MSKEFYKFVFSTFLLPHRYDIHMSSYEHVYMCVKAVFHISIDQCLVECDVTQSFLDYYKSNAFCMTY